MSHNQPDGYLALPAAGTGSSVLVLHAWWGLNDTIKTVCDRLAGAGFAAFAPDLYHGKVADTIAGAEILSSGLFADPTQAKADIAEAAAFLRAQTDQHSLSVIGFSLGAFFALDLSVTDPDHVRNVVIFYGTRAGDYSRSQAAYLGHFAETDAFEALSDVNDLEDSLKRAGRPVTFHHYSDTGHWFFEPDRGQAYHPASATLAWERTLAFLRDS